MINKIKKGFKPKIRTKEEIDKAYSMHAGQFAYKTLILEETIQTMQAQIDVHFAEMQKAKAEAQLLPPEPPKTPAPAQEPAVA